MAVDIKKMVDAICSLTVLELSKLVKALRDKFGLRTSDTNEGEDPDSDRVNGRAAENSNESDKSNSDSTPIEPEDKSSDKPIVDAKDMEEGEVPECFTEPAEEPNEPEKESKRPPVEVPTEDVPTEVPDAGEDPADKIADESGDESENKKESKPFPDPPSAEVPNASDEPEDKPNNKKKAETHQKGTTRMKREFKPDFDDFDSNWTPAPPKSNNPSPPSPPTPKGENYDLVYAWRYSDNKKYAKIGESTKYLLHTRMPTTYYPTGDPVLIGIRRCKDKAHAVAVQNYILGGLERLRRDREWVEIDEMFREMIDKSFISDPDELKRIFGRSMKTEKDV